MKIKLIAIITAVIFCSITGLKAQQSLIFEYERLAKVNALSLNTDLEAGLYSTEAVYPGSESYRAYLHQLKLLRFNTTTLLESPKPTKSTHGIPWDYEPDVFIGNAFNGVPNDNDLAISNSGMIVSVCNSTMNVYDEQGVQLASVPLSNFADSVSLVANSYDPKVIYDPLEDKFVLVFLNGSSASSTNIIVCFSATNDPTGNWNVYALDGNPFANNAWSDFPMIAINQRDFFVTVNHINSDSASWQTGFMQSVIWQVDKLSGFNGNSLSAKVHGGVNFGNKPIRNLLPIKGGYDLKNEEMYFISNRNFDFTNDTFFIVKISQSLATNPNNSFSVDFAKANQQYGVPPDAKQTATTFLQTNDARPLSGFIENGKIHFVGNTVDENDLAAIYHARYNTLNTTAGVDLHIINDTVLEFGYPNISFSGQSPYDEQAIISFNHTSIDSFPGMSAVYYNAHSGYTNRLHLQSGNCNINVLSGNYERWGDYSGSQVKYNNRGEVWVNGFVGFYNSLALSKNQHRTYLAKLWSPDTTYTALHNFQLVESKLYPNPAPDYFNIEFDMEQSHDLQFYLLSASGQKIKRLLVKEAKQGHNVFYFNTNSLTSGLYFIQAINEKGDVILQEKVIK